MTASLVPQQNLTPVVISSGNPDAALLLHLRSIIQRLKDVSDIFIQYRKEGKSLEWLRDVVVTLIMTYVGDGFDYAQVLDAVQYLADEYAQLGEGYFIVSTETGRVQAVLTEDDLYDPPQLARYSGDLTQPLKRIKPSLEVMVVTYNHEQARDAETRLKLILRHPQTQLQLEEGDSRFRMASREGRKSIARDVGAENTLDLLRRSGGTTGRFLQFVHLQTEAPFREGFDAVLGGTLTHRSTTKVLDPLAVNYGFNQLGTLKGTIPQGWIRDLCRTLARAAYAKSRGIPCGVEEVTSLDFEGCGLWVANPDTVKFIHELSPKIPVVPVVGVPLIGFKGVFGTLVVPPTFQLTSQERFGRWEVVASTSYELFVNWQNIRVFPILGIPTTETTIVL